VLIKRKRVEASALTPGSIGCLPLPRREERSSIPITLRRVDISRGLEDAANGCDGRDVVKSSWPRASVFL
jgi:hypothetical protein